MTKSIFISYSRHDQKTAYILLEKLEALGHSVWIDQERIDGAVLWQKEIVQAIQDARVVILFASKASFNSPNVMKEISLAFEESKPILPIFLEDTAIPTEFRYALAGIHRIELVSDANQKSWDSILNSIQNFSDAGEKISPKKRENANSPPRLRKVITIIFTLLILSAFTVWGYYFQEEETPPTSLIFGKYENNTNAFKGHLSYIHPGKAQISINSLLNNISCEGYGVATKGGTGDSCSGIEGKIEMECDDENKFIGKFKSTACYKGQLFVKDKYGFDLTFTYGLSQDIFNVTESEFKQFLNTDVTVLDRN